MPDYGIWSLLPPILAIVLAIATRQVFLSLFAGIAVGYLVINDWNVIGGLIASIDALVAVFQDADNTRVIIFSMLVGALITLVQRSGGVDGFIAFTQRAGVATGRVGAGLLALFIGTVIFIESTITCLVTGAVARPIFDRLRMSREKLAYVCDTSSAPICILIPLNGWGAFVLAQMSGLGVKDPVATLGRTIPVNFYAICSLLILFFVIVTGYDIGPMKKAERRAANEGKLHRDGARPMIADDVIALPPDPTTPRRAVNMILPIVIMVVMVFVSLAYTGYRNLAPGTQPNLWSLLRASSGTTAVLWAVATAVVSAGILYRAQGIMKLTEFVDVCLKGAGALIPLALLMLMAFAIGHLCKAELGTGQYVAGLVSEQLPQFLVAPFVFITACAIAFSTGTSWGTFAIMLPIAYPIALKVGAPPHLAIAAVLGGGVFGDHCSPISDTTIVSSMASACDHVDHVRTQLPYALLAGTVSAVLYGLVGLIG